MQLTKTDSLISENTKYYIATTGKYNVTIMTSYGPY